MFRPSRECLIRSIVLVSGLGLSPALFAQDPRQTVYFVGPNNVISAVTSFANGTAEVAATDVGTTLQGLVVRDDGQDGLKLIAANSTQGGGIRIYRADTGASLGQIVAFSSVSGVALDTSGDLYAVNADPGGSDTLLLVPRNTTCETPTPVG